MSFAVTSSAGHLLDEKNYNDQITKRHTSLYLPTKTLDNFETLGGGAAVAQWIRLRLQYYHTGFESQAHDLCLHQFIFEFKL